MTPLPPFALKGARVTMLQCYNVIICVLYSETCAHVRELTYMNVLARGVKQGIRYGVVTKQDLEFSPSGAGRVIRKEVRGDILLCQELTVYVQWLCHTAKVLNIWQSAKYIHII